MGWEQRSNGQYYYKKRRIGVRVVSEYIGAGGLAEAIARIEQLDQQRRQLDRAIDRAALEEMTEGDSQADEFTAVINYIVTAALLATGHYQHKRGAWRKRRMTEATAPADLAAAISRIQDEKPKKGDVAIVQRYIRETPDGWTVYGDLYRNAINSTTQALSGDTAHGKLLRTSIEERLKVLQ